jgi:hypothetical protein
MPYKPNYSDYSRAPQGWHDEPFEYVWSFSAFNLPVGPATQFNFFNNPLQFDPDADFFLRGLAILIDVTPVGEGLSQLFFNMRMRDSFGRPLDSAFIAMQAYATNPTTSGEYESQPGNPVATPWYPELYCPANSAMWVDFQTQAANGEIGAYSFHLYFQGVKRFQNEDCKPGSTTPSSSSGKSSVWFEGNAA